MKDTHLEITWTLLTTILVAVLTVLSVQAFMGSETLPSDAIRIKVSASQWQWQFTYPDGKVVFGDEGLELKKGQPVVFEVTSLDVIHSFNIPELGVKVDANPKTITEAWTIPQREGEYLVQCTEFCGLGHNEMRGKVIVK